MRKSHGLLLLLVILTYLSFRLTEKPIPSNHPGNEYFFGLPIAQLSSEQRQEFYDGQTAFNELLPMHNRPGSSFNALSCVFCHNIPVPGGSGIYKNSFVIFYYDHTYIEQTFERYTFQKSGVVENALPPVFTIRKAPPLYGLGLLEYMDDSTLFNHADPKDNNKDGISGRISFLDEKKIGRFGWKASQSSIENFTESAYEKEIGIQKYYDSSKIKAQVTQRIARVSRYLKYLSPPYDLGKPVYTSKGNILFVEIGCNNCHLETALTKAPESVLNNIRFRPFTDLLLHDMTNDTFLCRSEGPPAPSEFRTPPLWGLNSTGPPYMHNGGGKNLADAIDLHNGEGLASKLAFNKLSISEKDSLIAFLKSL